MAMLSVFPTPVLLHLPGVKIIFLSCNPYDRYLCTWISAKLVSLVIHHVSRLKESPPTTESRFGYITVPENSNPPGPVYPVCTSLQVDPGVVTHKDDNTGRNNLGTRVLNCRLGRVYKWKLANPCAARFCFSSAVDSPNPRTQSCYVHTGTFEHPSLQGWLLQETGPHPRLKTDLHVHVPGLLRSGNMLTRDASRLKESDQNQSCKEQ
ncbi:hypothetical protein Bbelb_438530 [Branchiostoma belcheri]|nr:hypothetical protein Bbelb_438530 [Branchiostoma belcheri]